MVARIRSIIVYLAISAAAFVAMPALAATNSSGYAGEIVGGTSDLAMKPGETKRVEINVKNTGTATWKKSDRAFPVMYTYFPKYRASVFRAANWLEKGSSPMKYLGVDVKPGATTTFAFDLKAPTKIGTYEEGFWLAAFDKTWIAGTQFKIKISVSSKPVVVAPAPKPIPVPVQTPTPVAATEPKTGGQADLGMLLASNFKAALMLKGQKVVARGGAEVLYRAGFKNSGDLDWPGYAVRTASVAQIASSASATLADMRLPSWPTANIALFQQFDSVKPGRVVFVDIPFRMPQKKGEYTLAFHLNVVGEDVDGGLIEIPVTVTDDSGLPPPPVPTQPPPATFNETLEPMPILRVGLYKTTTGESITGNMPYHVQDTNGKVFFDQPTGSSVTLLYEGNRYKAMSDQGLIAVSELPLRLVGRDGEAIFTVATRPNRPIWNDSLNDNSFRGVIEIRYAPKNDATWIINELPIEEYLKGLIEAGEGSSYPAEYQKALVTAARSYAYYHYSTKAKHKDRGFDVDAHYDQVYRGYGAESRQPRTAAAVDATRGQVVRYLGDLAVTPYYTRSDGRTRSYQEVWFKAVPYLISVPATYDIGKALNGHGVGMSQWDAIGHAKYDGWGWQQIVKYYYTGVDIAQKW